MTSGTPPLAQAEPSARLQAAPRARSLWGSLSRSQVAAAAATGVDFGLLFVLVEAFHFWYVLATALGALAGGVTNFFMNRHWSFLAAHQAASRQMWRYSLVSAASLGLNTLGVYAMTESLHIHYGFSVIAVSTFVGLAFNFPLHRHYVFR